MQREIDRVKYEMNDLRHNRPGSSARRGDIGYHHDEKSDGGAAASARRALHMTPQASARPQGHDIWVGEHGSDEKL